ILGFEGKIGVVKGSTGALVAERRLKRARVKVFRDAEDGAKALARGRIDMFIHDIPSLSYLLGQVQLEGVSGLPLGPATESLAWGIRRGDQELLDEVNRLMKSWKESGWLQETVRRWTDL
ncbi:MAG: transporter substrate-binding domain-containing protein, partial [Verrucomicrobiota bacterium]